MERLRGITGAMSEEECQALYDLARVVPENQAIVEIGAWRGLSTASLALGAKDGLGSTVYSIDPHAEMNVDLGSPFGDYGPSDIPKFYDALKHAGVETQVRPIMIPDYCVRWTSPTIGLLFIDASHKYADTLRQWKSFEPHMDPSAPIVFDDRDMPGVRKAIEDLGWETVSVGNKVAVCRRKHGESKEAP